MLSILAAFDVTSLDYCLEVLHVNQFQVPEFLPPVLELADDNVLSYQSKLYFILGMDFPLMCTSELCYRIATVLGLALSCRQDLLGQHEDVQTLAFVW